MDEETLRVLEYDKIRDLLGGFTVTGPGRERALGLAPLEDRERVEAALAEVAETVGLLKAGHGPPVGGCRDLRGALQHLSAEGTWLLPEVLLEVLSSLEAAAECRRYFADREEAPRLADYAGRLEPCPELRTRIAQSIGRRGEILDQASFELGELRGAIRKCREAIKRTLENLLNAAELSGVFQDKIVTERNDRYVVPVRADHRGQIKGFVHAESASGQTLFVEPTAVLERNNELRALLQQEQREIERILRGLSEAVRGSAQPLSGNQEILAHLDFTAAAGRFAVRSEAVVPELAAEPLIELQGARHPLLLFRSDGTPREEAAVPVDVRLGAGIDTLVISGPNTGGKTVALKTAGLLPLLVSSGLPVPCRPGSRVGLFARVFADIGDEQSIEASLSTFSGHLTRLRRILEEAVEGSLVLLDEAGTGTDPAEGGALAMAALDFLRRRRVRTVLTTHLNLLKGYAHLQEGVENAAVEFDSHTLTPTYRLHYGIPGASNAFTIARRLGLPEEVLEGAVGYLGEGEREGLELIERLNRLRRDLEAELAAAESLREEARRERQERRRQRAELEERRREILERANRSGEELVRDAESRLRRLLKEAREAGARPDETARIAAGVREVREELKQGRPEPRREGPIPQAVEAGEIVRVTALGVEATVVRQLNGEVELDLKGKKLRQPLAGLEQFSPRRFAERGGGRQVVSDRVRRPAFTPRLVLVGRRADEARELLERFLDDALLHAASQVEIVHGSGTGALRRAVRDLLAQSRAVSAFYAADAAHGGENVTVAELRG